MLTVKKANLYHAIRVRKSRISICARLVYYRCGNSPRDLIRALSALKTLRYLVENQKPDQND